MPVFASSGSGICLPPRSVARWTGLRQHASESLLLGWTPGLPLDHLPELEGIGLDFVFSSLPWWDFRADWFWTEADALSRIAPVIAAPEAPFGARLLGSWHDPAEQLAAYRRALLFAAGIGPGWLMPMGFEYGAAQSLDPARDAAEDWGLIQENAPFDVCPLVSAANAARLAEPVAASRSAPRLLSGPGAGVTAVLRTDAADPRFGHQGMMMLRQHKSGAPQHGVGFAAADRGGRPLPALHPASSGRRGGARAWRYSDFWKRPKSSCCMARPRSPRLRHVRRCATAPKSRARCRGWRSRTSHRASTTGRSR